MRELRIGTWLAAMAALVAFGCDENRPPDSERDGGPVVGVDSGGGGGTDSGPPQDSGTMTMTDSGMTGRRCGPTTGPCDVSNPTSCGTGMACLLTQDGATVTTICLPATSATEGAACDSSATTVQCAEGLACGDEGLCRRYCCSNADCNPAATGQICNIFGGTGPDGQEVGLCLLPEGCTLVPQSGCDSGESCNLISTTGDTVCDGAGTLTEGMECMFRNHCVAGFACIGTASEPGRCRQYCDMTATMPCPGGFMCNPLTNAPANVGVCIPMT